MFILKFKYLGTAAAEGWPSMFCSCENCKRAIAAAGRNIRTRSQAVIDDKLLIDFPADTYLHVLDQSLDLTKINHCIITHDHSDHLYAPDFENRRKGFAALEDDLPLTIYGTEPAGKKSQEIIDLYDLSEQGRVVFKCITPFVPFNVENYTVTPLKADHDPLCNPVFYIINDGKKTILYAHDTGYFPDETWLYFEKYRPHFDFISLDCTFGPENCSQGHMGLNANIDIKERLLKAHLADNNTIFCLNHFSHNGNATYDEFVPIASQYGFLVSYDGMMLEI